MSSELYDTFYSTRLSGLGMAVLSALHVLYSGQHNPLRVASLCTQQKEPNSTDDICLSFLDILTLYGYITV